MLRLFKRQETDSLKMMKEFARRQINQRDFFDSIDIIAKSLEKHLISDGFSKMKMISEIQKQKKSRLFHLTRKLYELLNKKNSVSFQSFVFCLHRKTLHESLD